MGGKFPPTLRSALARATSLRKKPALPRGSGKKNNRETQRERERLREGGNRNSARIPQQQCTGGNYKKKERRRQSSGESQAGKRSSCVGWEIKKESEFERDSERKAHKNIHITSSQPRDSPDELARSCRGQREQGSQEKQHVE